jgi:hypothetical protein
MVVGEKIEQRKDDGEGFLHAEETVEGPFAVELENWFAVRRFASKALIGDDVLTGVVAFGGAVPEEKAMLEGWCFRVSYCCPCVLCVSFVFLVFCVSSLSRSSLLFPVFVCGCMSQGLQIEGPPDTQLVAVHVCEFRVSWLLAPCAEELLSQVIYLYLDAFLEVWQAVA